MPYYIYQISASAGGIVKNLQKIEQLESFKLAKNQVRELRGQHGENESVEYKIIFADSALDAEEKLQEKRDAPIVMEWEK